MTSQNSICLLAVDDDPQVLQLLQHALHLEGVEIVTTSDSTQAMELVERNRPRIVILDLMMPGIHGMDLLPRILEFDPGIDVVMLSGSTDTEEAAEAIKNGAADFISKPADVIELRKRIGALVDEVRKRQRTLQLDQELVRAFSFEGLVGRSAQMLDIFDQIARLAPHYRTLLVAGETGTGKELVARALHRRSPVASGPFVTCNCSAIVETLFESELFGHVKGAFTGATRDRIGFFEAADGGTLFLDEVGDMPLTTQVKLLRVLQQREVQRVGSNVVRKVEVRVVGATNRDLRTMVAMKQFRDDLYHRLCTLELRMPSLAERKEDLPLLVRHFLGGLSEEHGKRIVGLTRRAQKLLGQYSWPGNVRELENVLRHAFLMAPGSVIDMRDLPERLHQREPAGESDEDLLSLEQLERRHARRVLDQVGGNKAMAAKILDVSRATLYRLLAEEEPAREKTRTRK
jgi:DNA-binding NtrC family response regulator